MPITWNHLCMKVITGQTSGNAGMRTNVAHGLPFTPNINHCFAQAIAADDDNNAANGAISIVSVGATNVVIKSSVNATPFNLIIFLDTDQGNQRLV